MKYFFNITRFFATISSNDRPSDIAIGSTLEQIDDKGKLIGVINYYFVMKKEFLAIIECLKQFGPILRGRRFMLRSDHLSLTYIISQKKIINIQIYQENVLYMK